MDAPGRAGLRVCQRLPRSQITIAPIIAAAPIMICHDVSAAGCGAAVTARRPVL